MDCRKSDSVDLFLLAGEPSADLHGSFLIEELLRINPALRIAAIAGPRMRKLPIQCVEPMENLQVMGFVDVALALPKIVRLFYSLRKKIIDLSPKAFVGIDYPGFNLRMHRALKQKGYCGKQIHYICPTVWAWGKKRIPLMVKNLDLLLTILPFEPSCFAETPLQTKYVGHPLTEKIAQFRPCPNARNRWGLSPSDKLLALFPGSRKHEVERNLPLMLKTASHLKARDQSLRIAISAAHETTMRLAAGNLLIPATESDDLCHNAHLALAKSGTIVLELALHKIPTVVQYAIKPLDHLIATKIFNIKLPFYSIANLIAQKEVFPELFGPNLSEAALIEQAEKLWFDEERRNVCRETLQELACLLGNEPASRNAARSVINCLPAST